MDSSILVEGKEYISASRASKKVGYATDYIGQLCRAKKIPGKLIGRTWYVDSESLDYHRKHRKLGKRRKVPPEVIVAPTVTIPIKQEIKKVYLTKVIPSTSEKNIYEKVTRDEPEIISPQNLNNIVITYEKEDSSRLPELSKERKIVYKKRGLTHKQLVIATTLMFIMVVAISILQFDKGSLSRVDSIYGEVSKISMSLDEPAFVREAFSWIRSFFSRPLAKDSKELADKRMRASHGLVVVPEGDERADTISRIKDSFSDGVDIKFDEAGDSGVITPVFTETDEIENYAFVLVPIEESTTNNQQPTTNNLQ